MDLSLFSPFGVGRRILGGGGGSRGFQGGMKGDQSPLTEFGGGKLRNLTASERDHQNTTDPYGVLRKFY